MRTALTIDESVMNAVKMEGGPNDPYLSTPERLEVARAHVLSLTAYFAVDSLPWPTRAAV